MLNIASFLIGLVALILAIPSFGVGAMSSKNSGRNFCVIVLVIAILRLMLGGGLV